MVLRHLAVALCCWRVFGFLSRPLLPPSSSFRTFRCVQTLRNPREAELGDMLYLPKHTMIVGAGRSYCTFESQKLACPDMADDANRTA